jgi:hypothetical protein
MGIETLIVDIIHLPTYSSPYKRLLLPCYVSSSVCLIFLWSPPMHRVQEMVQAQREAAEDYLRLHLATIQGSVGIHGTAFRLQLASGAAPLHGVVDYARLALDARAALDFNPFLSESAAARLQQGARVWLQLCVLEDRLQRLVQLVQVPLNSASLVQVRVCSHICIASYQW